MGAVRIAGTARTRNASTNCALENAMIHFEYNGGGVVLETGKPVNPRTSSRFAVRVG
jgi:hypothetical protein